MKKPDNITTAMRLAVGMRALLNDYYRDAHSESTKRGVRAARLKKTVADAKIN